ncbi:phosphotransferase enzyme family protein [Allosphingosinicella deserti]|uniref:Aminoglycoside phosphotransferase domain-containing protein n=1 Tax=Allosphingosinicella deserti TaxID=2116704 RepID=A0A2P7QK02_9SPHN|nr:aminoglycoside phosphotransferase family protein [Sphingomonas deserti]PSJ38306.1 hypothetical protein C7I55_17785 [Sphingomonas deserti]
MTDRIDAAAAFGIVPRRVVAFGEGRSNRSFHLLADDGRSFTLTELVGHAPARAEALLLTLDHLEAHRMGSHRPLRTVSGARVIHGHWPWMIMPFIPGETLSASADLPVEAIAALLARIHRIPVPAHLADRRRRLPCDWRTLLRGHDRPDLEAALAASERMWSRVAAEPALTFVHGDLFPDNIVRTPDGLVPIDWEHAAADHPMLDLGITAVGILAHGGWRQVDRLVGAYAQASGRSVDRGDLEDWIGYSASVLALSRFVRDALEGRPHSYASMLNLGRVLAQT